jgi:serine/threonine protein kinase
MSEGISPALTDLIVRLLVIDPRRRLGAGKLSALEIKEHPFFNVSSFPISVNIR